jgi:hypothetical protein
MFWWLPLLKIQSRTGRMLGKEGGFSNLSCWGGWTPSSAHQKFCVRLPRKLNFERNIRYNISIVFFFKREKSKLWGESAWNGSVIHLSLTASENYLENLNCRLTRWSLIVSLVSNLFSSTKSFKREIMSKLFRSSFLIPKPNFPINGFTLSVAAVMLVSFLYILMSNALNYQKISLKYANLRKNVQHILD